MKRRRDISEEENADYSSKRRTKGPSERRFIFMQNAMKILAVPPRQKCRHST
jgi:hypothetical protein